MQPRGIVIGPGGTPFPVLDDGVPHLNGKNGKADNAPSVSILPATAYTPEAVRWLWPYWLARGKFHMLAGAPGTGKTTVALSVAATISTGGKWADGSVCEAGDVLMWSGEDGITDTLSPRLLVAGGNPNYVHFVDGITEHGKAQRAFDPGTDMPALVKAARQLPNLKLIVLDPIVSVVMGDSHKNTEVRRGLQPVADMAGHLDCAVLGISHFSKATSGREPMDRIAGSIAFAALARIAWGTVKTAETGQPRRLVRVKSNLGPDDGGFAYDLFLAAVPGHGNIIAQRVDWGEPLEGSARELMAVEDMDTAGEAIEEAETFLADALRDGPMATREIKAAAIANGHAWRTVNSAKKALGIKATKSGFDAGWSWQMPDAPSSPKDAREGAEGC